MKIAGGKLIPGIISSLYNQAKFGPFEGFYWAMQSRNAWVRGMHAVVEKLIWKKEGKIVGFGGPEFVVYT